MLAVVSLPGMGRGWCSASELPEAQGSPGVQALPGPRCPALGPPPPHCRRRVRLAFSASPRVSGACGGRESLGAAERVLPPGVFTTCSHTLPTAAIVLPP